MQVRRVGEHALLVECADLDEVRATYADLRVRADELGAVDVVPAARSVLLDGLDDPGVALQRLRDWTAAPTAAPESGPQIKIPTRYDGPDLDEVARQWGTDAAGVVRIHQQCEFVVAFCGFAPGFAYCAGLPAGLEVARRAEPRPRVPAGAVALAGGFTSVYPSASPGGWQLIGTTTLRVWREGSDSPALLAPGTRVRFVDA
ncbi:MAG: kipI [Marmoricola sp.]|nr:kipI [Marmoricola sp.]